MYLNFFYCCDVVVVKFYDKGVVPGIGNVASGSTVCCTLKYLWL
jgi:hypothetical protein